jgi:monofunctional biosynthetic peptidoglycan transglycosylase
MASRSIPRPRSAAATTTWPRRITGWAIRLVLGFVLLSVLWVLILRFVPPPITLTMLGDVPTGHGITKSWRSLSSIDSDMPRAVIAAEDSRFCAHNGFDYMAIANAARRNAIGGRIRGGSTISQQTAKNVFLWQNGGYFRKGMEAWFTVLIEALWGKRRIMEVYLNVAETGIGTYGVEAGARRYFKHGADKITGREAAQIAAVLPLPKKRAGIAPTGFTGRYARTIERRIGVVKREKLDSCLSL